MKIGIVGLGLMGGSLGRALVARTTHTVYACDRDPEAMLKGGMLNAYHEELTRENAGELDIFLMAVVPSAMPDILKEYLPLLKSGGRDNDPPGGERPPGREIKTPPPQTPARSQTPCQAKWRR